MSVMADRRDTAFWSLSNAYRLCDLVHDEKYER
jgi:hypothetical protein